jgi:hypothetical protein
MTKLTDTQCVLLSAAAKRDTLSLYPLPDTLKPGGGLHKTLTALTTRGLLEERETTDAASVSRSDGDYRYGLFVTPAGLTAMGIDRAGNGGCDSGSPKPADIPTIERTSKSSAVLELLRRKEGATLAELIETTAWLPHTTRAALTGLRKKGHAIERGKRGDTTCYFLRAA